MSEGEVGDPRAAPIPVERLGFVKPLSYLRRPGSVSQMTPQEADPQNKEQYDALVSVLRCRRGRRSSQ